MHSYTCNCIYVAAYYPRPLSLLGKCSLGFCGTRSLLVLDRLVSKSGTCIAEHKGLQSVERKVRPAMNDGMVILLQVDFVSFAPVHVMCPDGIDRSLSVNMYDSTTYINI